MQLSPLGHTLHRPAASSSRATRLARPAGGQPLAIRQAGCSCIRQVQQRQPTRCAADGQDGGQGKGFRNPFGGGGKKEDDARKQLQNLFKDKPDMLSMYDAAPPGGGGKGGGKGGGDGGDWRNFDWRSWGRRSWGRLRDSLKGFAQVLGAIALFAGVLLLVSTGPAVVSFATGLLRRVLRLGGSGRARRQVQPHTHTHDEEDDSDSLLGPYERKMIAKYGAPSQPQQEAAAS